MKCSTPNCTNKAAPFRTICHKCRSKKYKEKHPFEYWFNALRNNARRRGKEFTLTIEEFKEFCKQTGYDEKKGKTTTSLSIDRIRPGEGYSAKNIQAITLSENSYKKDHCVGIDENEPPF